WSQPGSAESGRAMEAMVDKAQSCGGVVDERSAPGLIAAFGLARVEDALEHAAFAAVAIRKIASRAREENPARPDVILALHTELTRVGRHREGVSVDGAAKRPAWETLERLAARAGAGTGRVSPDTAALLARRFELLPMGSVPATGSKAGAHLLVGARDFEHGLTAFVGREAELGLLGQRFDEARSGHGQLVSIVGEPGIGKSRLLREFRRHVRD